MSSAQVISESYILVILEDPLTYDVAQSIATQVEDLVNFLHTLGKPALILCEIKGSSMVDLETRKLIADATAKIKFDKIAAYGSRNLMRNIANLTLMAVGKYDTTRLFNTEKEAKDWLQIK